jgi:hypothetical protein
MIRLFRLSLPGELIGSITNALNGSVEIVPRMLTQKSASFDAVLGTLEEYISYVCDRAISHQESLDTRSKLEDARFILLGEARQLMQPYFRRSALRHEDPVINNYLVDTHTGNITGIVDWEYHSVVPAVLAADYPSWVIYSGVAEYNGLWFERREEAEYYRDVFEQVACHFCVVIYIW